eukprot:c7220_g1_i2.p1 GENE.c7220_g1_i2~~c7220_g1_i2.p1  ORF type:complete len:257 (+),score=32.65 c7220_g1_i2:50-820(+)
MTDNEETRICTKSFWLSEEDQLLESLVQYHGPRRWSLIAQSFRNRTGKQCRERWHNHLNPDVRQSLTFFSRVVFEHPKIWYNQVRKDSWDEREDALILRLVEQLGSRWAAIARLLPGRTDSAVKNRYYSHLKKIHKLYLSRSENQNSPPPRPVVDTPKKENQAKLVSHSVVSCVTIADETIPLVGPLPNVTETPEVVFEIDQTKFKETGGTATISAQQLRQLLAFCKFADSQGAIPCTLRFRSVELANSLSRHESR